MIITHDEYLKARDRIYLSYYLRDAAPEFMKCRPESYQPPAETQPVSGVQRYVSTVDCLVCIVYTFQSPENPQATAAAARYLHILNKALFDSPTIEPDAGYSPELLKNCIVAQDDWGAVAAGLLQALPAWLAHAYLQVGHLGLPCGNDPMPEHLTLSGEWVSADPGVADSNDHQGFTEATLIGWITPKRGKK